jgi:hypothetical protein
MQTSLPDLPFDPREIITADSHTSSYSTPRAFPKTDLKQFELWQTFTTDIHTAIKDAMAVNGIVDGTNVTAGENLRRLPQVVECEDDIHEIANTELHVAVREVLRELGVEGRFHRPRRGQIGIIGEADFSWLHVGTNHPKLVVRSKSLESPAPLFVNGVFSRWSTSQIGSRISWIYVQALKQ